MNKIILLSLMCFSFIACVQSGPSRPARLITTQVDPTTAAIHDPNPSPTPTPTITVTPIPSGTPTYSSVNRSWNESILTHNIDGLILTLQENYQIAYCGEYQIDSQTCPRALPTFEELGEGRQNFVILLQSLLNEQDELIRALGTEDSAYKAIASDRSFTLTLIGQYQ